MYTFGGLFSALASGSGGGSDASVKIAIITAISVVLAAGFTAIAQVAQDKKGSRSGDRQTDPTQALLDDLLRRTENSEMHNETLQARIDYLETLCWRNGVDPDTGRKASTNL